MRFDENYIFDDGLFFDTKVANADTIPLLSPQGTTKQLTQQLDQDRGTGSIQSFNVAMVDLNGFLTDLFGSDELLGVNCNAYMSFAELEHPTDSVRIFSGIISDVKVEAGKWILKVDNPDSLKNQVLFVPYSGETVAAVSSLDTTIYVNDVAGISLDNSDPKTYLRIDDELMLVSSIDTGANTFNVVRAQIGTSAVAHNDAVEVASVYRLQGNPIETALKLMLSTGNQADAYYSAEVDFFVDGPSNTQENTIFINEFNVGDERGVAIGDTCTITGSSGADGDYLVSGVSLSPANYTAIRLDGIITADQWLPGVIASFTSNWNQWLEGCAMQPSEVDVTQHQTIMDTFGQQFPDIDVLLSEEITAKDFIEQELYRPVGAYFLTRKGRASIGYTAPSISSEGSVELNSSNLKNLTRIVPRRSIASNFYNSVIYKLGYNLISDKFTSLVTSISNESTSRIRNGLKALTIETKSYAGTSDNENFFSNLSLRLLDRYKFAALTVDVEPTFGVAFALEVGDTVTLNGQDFGLFDSSTGKRDTFLRVMEIINRTMDLTTGKVTLKLLDTSFGIDDRYATFAPSSYCAGGTVDRVKIKTSFGTDPVTREFEKWTSYVGGNIQVRASDFSFQETVELIGIDESDTNFLIVSELSSAPLADYIVELPPYDEQNDTAKLQHASFCPQVAVVSGIDGENFTVDAGDVDKFFVGSVMDIHTADYVAEFKGITVTEIDGNTITIDQDLGITLDNTYLIDKIGFSSDEGNQYSYF